jgi:ATP-dependent Zn protease
MVGADLENLVNLAALQTVRKAKINKSSVAVMIGEDFLSYIRAFMKDKKKPQVNYGLHQ